MRVRELIDAIRRRPGAFLKEEKIEYVFYFLFGYCGACHDRESPEDHLDSRFCCWFGRWLLLWIEDNIDSGYVPRSIFWYEDIQFIARNEGDEMAVFYDLCGKFFDDYANRQGYFSWRDKSEPGDGDGRRRV